MLEKFATALNEKLIDKFNISIGGKRWDVRLELFRQFKTDYV